MTAHRCDSHPGRPCPRPDYSAQFYHPQIPVRSPDGSPLLEIVLGVVILIAFVVGLGAWAWIADASAVAR